MTLTLSRHEIHEILGLLADESFSIEDGTSWTPEDRSRCRWLDALHDKIQQQHDEQTE